MPILVIIMLIMVMDIFDKNLSTFLFNKTRRGLLSLLYSHPNETYYINQLMQVTGSGSGAVQRELKLMLEAGVLVRTHSGNLVYYQANEKCPIFNELKSIVRKTFGVADIIRQTLAPITNDIGIAFIFGSIARGDDDRKSDIDVMVVGSTSFGEVVGLLSSAEEQLAREINTVVYPVPEFKKKVKEDHHFVSTVLEGEKIFLIGDESELRGLATG